jgi:hypothetical protein
MHSRRASGKFSAICTCHFQAIAMIEPCNYRSHREEQLKLEIPNFPFKEQQAGLKVTKPISVETNMPRFIFQNHAACFVQHRVARASVQQA